MKKSVVLIIVVIGLIISLSFTNLASAFANETKIHFFTPYNPPAESKEELYQDIFITLLDPYISKAIENYYGKPYAYDPWDVVVLNAERPNGYRTINFKIKLQIMSYIGAHNTIGIDNLTISIPFGEEPKIEKFEHIKSYEIPPWLR